MSYKTKTKKAVLYRIKIKASGIMRKTANMKHLFLKKSSKRLRRLSQKAFIHTADTLAILKQIPYF